MFKQSNMKKNNRKVSLEYVVKFLILSIGAIITMVPLIFMLVKSFEINGIYNYITVIQQSNIVRNFLNSTIVTLTSIVLEVICVSLAAFAFSKLKFRFKNILYLLFLCTLMLPGASVIFPMFLVIKKLGLVNNYVGLIGPYVAILLPFNLIILKNYYDTIPNEFMEAAAIDGCGKFKTLWKVLFPMSLPALSVVIIWTFIGCWNEYMFAFIFIDKLEMRTVTALPDKFVNLFGAKYNLVFATLVIIEIPLLLMYLFAQKSMQKGLVAGGIKG